MFFSRIQADQQSVTSQTVFTSKSTMEAREKCVKSNHS